jgi:hypothetical protein
LLAAQRKTYQKLTKTGNTQMSNEFTLSEEESNDFSKALELIKGRCNDNQLSIGLLEMAVGSGLVAWGVHNGVIEMGSQLVATQIGGANVESIVVTLGGTGIGVVAGSILGSIGIVGMGGAIGIPAALVIGGSSAVLGMAGYTAGDIAHNISASTIDFNALTANGSVLLIGVALIIDGARRVIKDEAVLSTLSVFKEKVIYLNDISVEIVAKTKDDLMGFVKELRKLPEDKVDASISALSATIPAIGGVLVGVPYAAGTVTVLGSSTLGGVALSLGLVSATLWPVIAGVVGGAGLGYAAYKAIKYWGSEPEECSG